MALIECYECGKEISSLAHSCPACGAPKKHTKKKKATKRNASSVELTDRQREQIESIEATSVKKKTVKKRAAKTQRSDNIGEHKSSYSRPANWLSGSESSPKKTVKKKTVKKRAAKTQRSDKLDSKKYRGDIAPNVSKSAVSKVKKKTSQKHQTKKSVSKVNKIEDGYVKSKTPPKSQWPQIIDTIEEYLSPLRPVIFKQCVDAVKKNATFFSSLNKKLTNKIELPIAITQYHLVGRRIQLLKYITPKNGSDFMTMFFDAALKFGSTEERNHYYLRYDIDYLEGNPEKRFLFADICQYIKKQPCHFCEPEPVVLDAFLSHKLELGACISAAMAFKDKDSIKELAPQIGADANRLISGL